MQQLFRSNIFQLYIFLFLSKLDSFSHTTHPDYSLPFFHSLQVSPTSSFPQIHFLSVSSAAKSRSPIDDSQSRQARDSQLYTFFPDFLLKL